MSFAIIIILSQDMLVFLNIERREVSLGVGLVARTLTGAVLLNNPSLFSHASPESHPPLATRRHVSKNTLIILQFHRCLV